MRFPEFSGEWEKHILGDYIKLQGGYAFKSEKFKSVGIPIIRISNLPQESTQVDLSNCVYYDDGPYDNFIVKDGDLLIAMSGATTGKTAIFHSDKKAFLNQRVGCFRSASDIHYPFLYAIVQSSEFHSQLGMKLIAGAQPNISSSDIETIHVKIPSIKEQQKISSLFNLIEERIIVQNKVIEKYESLIKALYKLTIPCNDVVSVPLGELVHICKGKQLNSELLSESGSYYVMNGGITPSGYYDTYNTPKNTISISEGGNSCGYVQFNATPFWSGGHCYSLLNPDEKRVSYKFLYHFLKCHQEDIMALRIGSGLPNIQKKDIEKYPIQLPTFESQVQLAMLFDLIESKEENEKVFLLDLESTKDYLLKHLFI